MRKIHYRTSENKILCSTKFEHGVFAHSRFSYKVGAEKSCKMCDKILNRYIPDSVCVSEQVLGYDTVCHWRDVKEDENYCKCIDDCRFKHKLNNE